MTTGTTTKPLAARVEAAMEAVWAADTAWAEALDDPAAKAAYKAARAAYKALADEAEDKGLTEDCPRCGGKGGWEGWPGFTCYLCLGHCKVPFRRHRFQAMPPTRAKNAAKALAKRAAEVAIEDAKYAGFAAADPEAAAFFAAMPEQPTDTSTDAAWEDWNRNHAFFGGLRDKARRYGGLTEAQRACVTREIAKRAAAAAEAAEPVEPFPVGEATVEGEIVATKMSPGGYGRSRFCMTVKIGGGNRAYGTVPAKVDRATDGTHDPETGDYEPGHEMVGTKVKFTAFFERSDRDEHFGFFKSAKAITVLALGEKMERG